jgi:hypothetical protein
VARGVPIAETLRFDGGEREEGRGRVGAAMGKEKEL